MSDLNKLKSDILEGAEQEGQVILKTARKKIEAEFSQKKASLLVELEASRQSQLKAMQDKFKVEVQEITNKERQRILLMKQEALKDLFDAALNRMKAFSKQEELAFMKKVFTNYQDQDIKVSLGEMTKEKLSQEDLAQLGELFPKLTFNPDTIAQEAGFIVSINQVDDTYLYSNLLGSIFKEESARISHVLFTES